MYCLTCDYPLDGLDQHRCPECGREFDPRNAGSYGDIPRTWESMQPRERAVYVFDVLTTMLFVVIIGGVILFSIGSILTLLTFACSPL